MSDVKECVEHGAGTCRNIDLIDALSAENAKLRTELDNAYKVIADYQTKIQPADCGELLD